MEGVMERPPPDEAERAEVDKWDAWNAQKGMSRTEAKQQYITTLIEVCGPFLSGFSLLWPLSFRAWIYNIAVLLLFVSGG